MDWTSIIKSVAPTVATALMGPLGGAAVAAIGGVLGIAEPTQKAISDIIQNGQMTPEQIGKLKELELQYQNDEKERQFKYADLTFQDVQSAREMEVATKSITPSVLSYGVLAVGGSFLGAVLFGYAKVDSVLAGTLVGYIVSEMKQVLAYWLGSSAGSADKTQIIANQGN